MGRFDFLNVTIEEFKEALDSRILLPMFGISGFWIVVSFLMHVNIFGSEVNTKQFVQIVVFSVMIALSFAYILYLGIKADFKESLDLTKVIVGALFALVGVYAAAICIAIISNPSGFNITDVVSLFKISSFALPSDVESMKQPIIINFLSFSRTFNFEPTIFYNVLTHSTMVAPAEELAFRAVGTYTITKLIPGISNVKGGLLIGGLGSNAVWASIHSIVAYTGAQMLINILTAFIGGIFFLLAMFYAKNIYAPILAHAVYNCVIVVATGM